ncbi:hypothetical protein SLS62_007807 [Diatrype stigma]|uniref:Uncharacterized protein n=1 Tax=Diatrype stigma TaxID=117547 RepID=A0AAN9YQF4_9PEZI
MTAKSEAAFSSLSQEIKDFVDLWSDGNRDISLLISTEAQNIKEHITVNSVMLSDQMKATSEANVARLDTQHGETKEHITSESTKIIKHFDTDRQTDTLRKEKEEIRTRILFSLWFPEMNARENNIMEASEDTCWEVEAKSHVQKLENRIPKAKNYLGETKTRETTIQTQKHRMDAQSSFDDGSKQRGPSSGYWESLVVPRVR